MVSYDVVGDASHLWNVYHQLVDIHSQDLGKVLQKNNFNSLKQSDDKAKRPNELKITRSA